jgi:hypothetical protein
MRPFDFILFIPYVLIVIAIFKYLQSKIKDKEVASYYLKGLYVKIVGTLATTVIYWYYYGTGDSIYYFMRTQYMRKVFFRDPIEGIGILFMKSNNMDITNYVHMRTLKAYDASSFIVVKLSFLFSFPALGSYIVIALFFSVLCYFGLWRLYLKSVEIFPDVSKKYLAYAVLFIPSVFFWGSGLFKDTVTLGFACLVIASFHDVFIKRKNIISGLFFIILGGYLIGTIKSYILLVMLPSMLIWYLYTIRSNIKSAFLRASLTPILIVFSAAGGLVMLQQLSKVFTKFNLDNIEKKAEDMQRWHTVRGAQLDESSTYSLGHIEFNALGILKKIPAAVNVTFFRPYIWEVHNPVMMMAAAEALFFLLLTLYLIFRQFKIFSHTIRSEPFLMFCLIFAIVFGFSVGLTAYNFGALVRYKIPALPMFGIVLAVVYSRVKMTQAKALEAKIVE